MSAIKVGVLRGGLGGEYEVSLNSGAFVLQNLPAQYQGLDVLIDRGGTWHWQGLPIEPRRLARQVDVFFNALHGFYGEDGQVQNLLNGFSVPYTGSGSLASALAMQKSLAKGILQKHGIKTPPGITVRRREEVGAEEQATEAARAVFQRLSPPWVVKPDNRGSSVGVFFVRDSRSLASAIADCFACSAAVLVESYIRGREATGAVVDNLRGVEHYSLPVIEIRLPAVRHGRPRSKPVWDYGDKYSGETIEVCPGGFTAAVKQTIEQTAVKVHQLLGLRDYSRSDFIVSALSGKVYFLEANSLPGLTPASLLPKALGAVGISAPHFLDHVIKLALMRPG